MHLIHQISFNGATIIKKLLHIHPQAPSYTLTVHKQNLKIVAHPDNLVSFISILDILLQKHATLSHL